MGLRFIFSDPLRITDPAGYTQFTDVPVADAKYGVKIYPNTIFQSRPNTSKIIMIQSMGRPLRRSMYGITKSSAAMADRLYCNVPPTFVGSDRYGSRPG